MGSIEKILGGKDNVVRAAALVAVDNSLRKIRMKRPIHKPYRLEFDISVEVTSIPSGRTTLNASDMSVQMVRDEDIPIEKTAS